MEEIFMISQLMTSLNNSMRLGKYQQEKVMITQLVVYWILSISKKIYRLIAADLRKQKTLDADSKAIKQIIFTDKANADAMIY